jgi:hypothetical protein
VDELMYCRLPFQDVWQMFGEGVHPNFPSLFKKELAPFLSQGASKFWSVFSGTSQFSSLTTVALRAMIFNGQGLF